MQRLSAKLKADGKTIGFVPTMGFLHDGHLSLVKKSKEKTDVTIVSIFVNPTQFAPNEDLAKYPRDVERDKKLLKKFDVDYLFIPDVKEIYPDNFQTFIEVDKITKHLEGKFRPAHFKGVTTIVSILFNAVKPDFAFFGQKDAQQAAVIKQMVNDLKFDLTIIVCPIIREADGLALSSRNFYLSKKEREDALVLYKSLMLAKQLIKEGERDLEKIIERMKDNIFSVDSSNLDYIKVVNELNFEEVTELADSKKYYILIACRIGETRLIDNLLIKVS